MPDEAGDIVGPAFERAYPGVVPISALLIVEGLNPETNKLNLYTLADDSTMAWKSAGMLLAGLADEVRGLLKEDNE